ncbi:MAG: SDR family oxidoreductase [Alicyclobacillus herbarius]|uniref:SDR family NAD(P)-dependent oxidoreductase n=1 Tax=Alicyclobacillus herbarius TaxID=122960 RepID=UPI0023531808|nr:SDR family NAD(P)-dependent oxidoreductase [Alicyclobacillus herbarius]MCL6632645.1 SDR family oxidoreductase [Alicyclobacillus herbarius]
MQAKVAVVTGGGQGIGRAIAWRLADRGLAVVIADVDPDLAAGTAAEIRAAGGEALAQACDVCRTADVVRTRDVVLERFGRWDVLVNNAGWDKVEPFLESEEQTWRRVLEVNLLGTIRCTHQALPVMMKAGYGRIVNIGSDAGRVGSTGEAVYSAAKGGIIAFTKTIAREMAQHGITANTVCPGPTQTALLQDVAAANPRLVEAMTKAVPMRRLGEPEDIAAAVSFLISEDAGYITGQTLSVSGGLTMC